MKTFGYLLLATLLIPHEAFAPIGMGVRLKKPSSPPSFSLQMHRKSTSLFESGKTTRTPLKRNRTLLLLGASLIPFLRPGMWTNTLGAAASMKPFPLLAIAGLIQGLKSSRLKWDLGAAQKTLSSLSPQRRNRSSVLLVCGLILVSSFFSFGVSPAIAASTYPAASFAAPKSIVPPLSSTDELKLICRLVFAAVSGAAVGWERSTSKHSAGVRTMALVSLGAAAFTICSAYGFTGDPSRLAANVASGVGFLGAGVITTQARETKDSNYNIVHGLTTAAAIWLSAALGVASGVGLYVTSGATALCTVAILRLGKSSSKTKKKHDKQTPLSIKNQAQYHPSELLDTSEWDENDYEATPPLMGNDVAVSIRDDFFDEEEEEELVSSEEMHNEDLVEHDDWLSTFQNKTLDLPELVIKEKAVVGAENVTMTNMHP